VTKITPSQRRLLRQLRAETDRESWNPWVELLTGELQAAKGLAELGFVQIVDENDVRLTMQALSLPTSDSGVVPPNDSLEAIPSRGGGP
jgi:hypothetical protein